MARRATAPCPADQSHGGHIVGRDSLRRWKDRDSSLRHVTPRSCRLHGAVLTAAPYFFVPAQARKPIGKRSASSPPAHCGLSRAVPLNQNTKENSHENETRRTHLDHARARPCRVGGIG